MQSLVLQGTLFLHGAPLIGRSVKHQSRIPSFYSHSLASVILLKVTQDILCFLCVVAERNCMTVIFLKVGKEKKLNRPVACKPDSVYT